MIGFVSRGDKELENVQKEMPKYKSHKEVWALKIKEVIIDEESARIIVEDGYAPIIVGDAYALKHKPQAGGYYVVYKDGYESFSPAKAFEEGYTLVDSSCK